MSSAKIDDDFHGISGKDKSIGQKVRENIFSGITVALVSVPLSTALAIASGCDPTQGLTAAIIGPILGGLLGGSNYNILGPAGALVNILLSETISFGPKIIPYLAFFGGLLSYAVYLLKLERYCMLIPISVLEGFSMGVATVIGFGQLKFAFGI